MGTNTLRFAILFFSVVLIADQHSKHPPAPSYREMPQKVGGLWLGHSGPTPRPYNIWEDNCHNAANALITNSSTLERKQRGILVCSGNPESSVANHTANWEVLTNGETCIYNWGTACCWKAGQIPPSFDPNAANNDGAACATWACIGTPKKHLKIRFLPPGKIVEIADPLACFMVAAGLSANSETVVGDYSIRNRPKCLQCCDDRADYWSAVQWGADKKLAFLTKCSNQCSAVFGNHNPPLQHTNDTLSIRRGRKCAKSNWTRSTCLTCCKKFRDDGDFLAEDLYSCNAVCNGEFSE